MNFANLSFFLYSTIGLDLLTFLGMAGLLLSVSGLLGKKRIKVMGKRSRRLLQAAVLSNMFSTFFNGMDAGMQKYLDGVLQPSLYIPLLKLSHILFTLGFECAVFFLVAFLLSEMDALPDGRRGWGLFALPLILTCAAVVLSFFGNFVFIVDPVTCAYSHGKLYNLVVFAAPAFYLICSGRAMLRTNNITFLLVLVILIMTRIYFSVALSTLSSTPFTIALALCYAWLCQCGYSMLYQVAGFMGVLFVTTAILLGNAVSAAAFSSYLRINSESNRADLEELQLEVLEFQSLPWLVDYWCRHPEQAEAHREESVVRNAGDAAARRAVSVQAVQSYPERAQARFAWACYRDLEALFVAKTQRQETLKDIWLILKKDEDTGTVLLSEKKSDEGKGVLGQQMSLQDIDKSVEQHRSAIERNYINWVWAYHSRDLLLGEKLVFDCPGGLTLMIYDQVSADEANEQIASTRRMRLISIAVLTMAEICIILIFYFVVVRPLNKIKESISFYWREKDSEKAILRLEEVENIARNEVGTLSMAFSGLILEMERYMKQMTELAAGRERIETELNLARRIQAHNLPTAFTLSPQYPEIRIHASMTPAKEVGGDFYDFFMVDGHHAAMLIADVSGKGVPAAMFMMAARYMLKTEAMKGQSPAETLRRVNDMICSDNQDDMFVTVWLGILDLETGIVTAANAGHEYPAVYHGGRYTLVQDRHGLMLGWVDGRTYEEYTIALEPGDQIFVYTDGVTEANNHATELFGMERMIQALNARAYASPQEVLEGMSQAVSAFAGGEEQFDDQTMMCLFYGKKEG